MGLRFTLLASLVFPSAVSATQFAYDAGLPGSPSVAPSPVTQGFSEVITGGGSAGPLSPDPAAPLNAWQWNDPGAGFVRYTAAATMSLPAIYEFELVVRALAGRLRLEVHAGPLINDNLFTVQLDVVGTDLHVLRPGTTPLVLIDGANGYHSVRFVSGYAWDDAFVFFDGVYAGPRSYDAFASGVERRLVVGTESAPPGRARLHSAYFGPVRRHTFGERYCSPASPNSSGASGRIALEGSIILTHNDLTLSATGLPIGTFAYFLGSLTSGSAPIGQGTLCLGGSIGRFNGPGQVLATGALGAVSLAIGTTQIPTPTGPVAMQAGQTWHFQCWFRDAAPTPTSNLTDAWRLRLP